MPSERRADTVWWPTGAASVLDWAERLGALPSERESAHAQSSLCGVFSFNCCFTFPMYRDRWICGRLNTHTYIHHNQVTRRFHQFSSKSNRRREIKLGVPQDTALGVHSTPYVNNVCSSKFKGKKLHFYQSIQFSWCNGLNW